VTAEKDVRGGLLRSGLLAVGLGIGLLLALALMAQLPAVQRWNGDVQLYEHYARLAISGRLGDSPFFDWYPPPALVPLGLPLVAGAGPAYAFAFAAEMVAIAALGVLLVSRVARSIGADERVTWLYAALVAVSAIVIAWRYDIVPAVLVLAALTATISSRWALGGVSLGIAAGLKLYAALLAPLYVLWAWRRGGSSAALRLALGVAVAGLASIATYLLFPGASPFDPLAFTAARPVQLESVAGGAIGLAASLGIGDASVSFGFGSYNLTGSAAGAAEVLLRVAQPIAVVGTLAISMVAIWRQPRPSERLLVMASLAVLLALLVTHKVLSTQYLVWILPLVPLAAGWVRGLLTVAIVLTAIVFPWLYSALVTLEALPAALVFVRNLLLVAAWVLAVGQLWSLRSSERPNGSSSEPANSTVGA
jgi:hypothetical protein